MSVSSSEELVVVPVSFVSSCVSSFETPFESSFDTCSEVDSVPVSAACESVELTSTLSEEADSVASGMSTINSSKDANLCDSWFSWSYSSIWIANFSFFVSLGSWNVTSCSQGVFKKSCVVSQDCADSSSIKTTSLLFVFVSGCSFVSSSAYNCSQMRCCLFFCDSWYRKVNWLPSRWPVNLICSVSVIAIVFSSCALAIPFVCKLE